MLSVAAVRAVVENVATPDEFTFPDPSTVVPLLKLTVPSDEPVGAGVTVAVNSSVCPAGTGFGEAVTTVTVTVCAIPAKAVVADWLAVWAASPG